MLDIEHYAGSSGNSPNHFLELDTAAIMFPLAFSEDHQSLVRLSAVMNESIDPLNLQLAVDRLLVLFPSFYVRLVHDSLHYYFEKLDSAPKVLKDDRNESYSMTQDELSQCVFKVIVSKNRIILEYFHAVSDGIGGSIFLKSLIAEYLMIHYEIEIPSILATETGQEFAIENNLSDAYQEIEGNQWCFGYRPESYVIKGKKDTHMHITEFSFKTDKLVTYATLQGVTVTALIASILTLALFDLQKSTNNQKDIRLSIPVDLRRRFGCNTLRNFSLPISIQAKNSKNVPQFTNLSQSFHKQLKVNAQKSKLASLVCGYVKLGKLERNALLPLWLKKKVVQSFFRVFKSRTCLTLSNLGMWRIPEIMKPYIKQFSMSLSTKPATPYSCGVVTVGNNLTVTFTRSIKEPLIEERFQTIMQKIVPNSNNDGRSVYE